MNIMTINRIQKKTAKIQRGFTLIELVIVLAVLGTLAAVALPNFNDVISDAEQTALETQADALETATAINYTRSKTNPSPSSEWATVESCSQLNEKVVNSSNGPNATSVMPSFDTDKYKIDGGHDGPDGSVNFRPTFTGGQYTDNPKCHIKLAE